TLGSEMKSDKVRIFLLFTICVFSFYAGQAACVPDTLRWEFLLELSSILAALAALGTLYVAYLALGNWEAQIKGQVIFQTAIDLEDKLSLLYMRFTSGSDKLQNEENAILYQSIKLLCFRLRRRNFNVEVIKEIEEALSKIIAIHRDSGDLSDEHMDKLFQGLTKFSQSF
ncbi:hypothetical protein ACXLRA_004280, partial [Vibrio vulnificus]